MIAIERLTFAFCLATLPRAAGIFPISSPGQEAPLQPLTKRQREILDYLNEFIQQHGYAPSLEEIGHRFSLSSLATVHKHLTNLQEKGFIRRSWNRSRSVELLPSRAGGRAIELPMLGFVAAGSPIEAVASAESISVPETLVAGRRDTYVLRVRGESMIDEQIRDGDWVVVEDRKSADNGEMVIALVGGQDATLKKFYREAGRVRLQPANPTMQPIYVDFDNVQIQGVVVGVMRKY
jgi:repressor LexA